MAITNFIPTVWSENLYQALDKKYVAVANCNREFEGDIVGKGSVVKICGVGNIAIGDYTKNVDMNAPQVLNDISRELVIDQAKYFNFQIDDIDRAQANPKLMDAAMHVAASSLANEADKAVYNLYEKASHTFRIPDVDENEVFDAILTARQKLFESNVSDTSEIVVEISPTIATLLLKAKIHLETDNAESIHNGYLGKIAGCQVYVSNNIVEEVNALEHYFKCFVRTKRAIAFAEQLSEIDAYRPEKRFADAVKGLHLYGAEVIYPSEFVVMDLGIIETVM